MPAGADDVRRRISEVFLRGGRRRDVEDARLTEQAAALLSEFGLTLEQCPVNAVGLKAANASEPVVTIFLDREIHGFADGVARRLGADGVRIEQLVVGKISSSARPAQGGHSIGEGVQTGESGTFGMTVEDPTGARFILSCSHVFATPNAGAKGVTDIWQPSSDDGGATVDRIGALYDFEPIDFAAGQANRIDAALASPAHANDIDPGVLGLGRVNGSVSNVTLGTAVWKSGWDTGVTQGTLLYKVSVMVAYPSANAQALFDDQWGIVGVGGSQTRFSDKGDSGAVVLDNGNAVLGLIFADAAGIDLSFANPISEVLNRFGVSPA